ncbi:MAG: FxsA family protein [Pseudomonadota bacterium]
MPFGIVPFLLLFIPVLEIAVFILIGGEIGVFPTLGMILLTAIIGSILLRVQGFSILSRIQEKSRDGGIPGKELVNGVMIVIAGVLLLTPGFVTDSIGFLLFFPPFRQFLWSSVASRVIVSSGIPGNADPYADKRTGGNRQDHADRPNEEKVVDLDSSEFSEKPNPNSPWKDVR